MICPRCGAPVQPQARHCNNCGLLFAAPDDPRSQMPRPRSRTGTWSTDPPSPMQDGSGQWSMPVDPRQTPGSASGQWSIPLDQRQQAGNGAAQWPMSPPMRGGSMVPTPNVPSRPNLASRTPSLPGGLMAGASFQNGHFRVLGPFRPAQPLENRNPNYLAQWVAVDAMQRGDRVTLLELPLGDMVPALTERARETIANRMLRMGQNPLVQQVLGAFSERGHHFLVLEYFDGTFLSDRVARYGPLSERLTLGIADELLAALAMLERQSPPILHGHIAPETVVISPDGAHARLLCPSPALVAKALSIPFREPPAVGVGFVAPEHQHGQADLRSDLFSLGATLYYAATGFDAAARSATIFSPARQVNASLSSPTEAVLAKAVRQVPSQRYQYAEEMQLDIERANNGEMPTRDAVSNMAPLLPRTTTRNGPLAIVGIISGLLVVVLVGLILLNGQSHLTNKESIAPTVVVDATQQALAQKGEGLSSGTIISDTIALGPTATPANMCLASAVVSTVALPTEASSKGAVVAEELGAKALCNKDYGSATQYFKLAVQDDPSNAEALIYYADAQIDGKNANLVTAHQLPTNVVTLAVAVNFGPIDIDVSRDVLRGAAIAQNDLNQFGTLPGQAQVRIEIANVGSSQTDEGAAALADYYNSHIAKNDPNHNIGIISWSSRFITQASAANLLPALASLKASGVPVIAPIRTTDSFPPFPNLFFLSPTDTYQAGVMVQVALSQSASRVEIVQGNPAIASDLEIAGTANYLLSKAVGSQNVVFDKLDSTASDASIAMVVHNVQTHGAKMVLFAGTSHEALKLTLALAKSHVFVPIIAAANADDPSLIGQSTSPTTATDAQLAAANPQAMPLLHIVGLADEREWSVIAQAKTPGFAGTPGFFNEYNTTFTQPSQPLPPSANAIFAYDSVTLMVDAPINNGTFTATQLPTPQQVLQALSHVTAAHPFQGISGSIGFGAGNVPDNRSMVLKEIFINTNSTDANGNHPLDWKIDEIINQTNFCTTTTCAIGFP